jgi:hypothetical protein
MRIIFLYISRFKKLGGFIIGVGKNWGGIVIWDLGDCFFIEYWDCEGVTLQRR